MPMSCEQRPIGAQSMTVEANSLIFNLHLRARPTCPELQAKLLELLQQFEVVSATSEFRL